MPFNVFRIWIVLTFAAMLALSAGVGGRERKTGPPRNARDQKETELRRRESPERFDEPDKAAEFYLLKRTSDKNGFLFIAPFAMNRTNPQQLFTGGSYIWRTTNGGANWVRATNFANSFGVISPRSG